MPKIMSDDLCCNEFKKWSKRQLLEEARPKARKDAKKPAWLPRVVLADSFATRDALVVVFLRGGMDSLTTVVPYGDANLYTLRPNIAVQPPGSPDGAVDLDGFFGLPPAMAPLLPAYQANQLAFVHAAGSPDPTRSHFDAFKFMEYGNPLQPATLFSGWLARHLQTVPPLGATPLRAMAIDDLLPKMLADAPDALPITDPSTFDFPGNPGTAALRQAVLENTYALAGAPLAGSAQSTVDTINLLGTIDFDNYIPAGGAVYPNSTFGRAMKSVAAIIKAQTGLEVATVDLGGWDTHNNQGVIGGYMANLMNDLSSTLAAFHTDMQANMNELTLLAMTEFGRRADENVSLGTDHGHGSCMFAMGGNIAGGQVLANWTNNELLHPDLLYQNDSLDVTIDYRDIVSEVLQNRVNNTDLGTVFPNYTPAFQGITV